jgi:molybdenum cofactor cytidylyltransferase
MLPAVILAAGESRRMGFPKALLEAPGGGTFVGRIVRALADAGVQDVVIVTGAEHAAIADAIETDLSGIVPRLAPNPDPSRGQLSSLWVGMDAAVRSETEGLLVTLVDVPLLRAATVRQVIEVWRNTRAPIVRPAIGDRHGHPVLFDCALFDELRAAPLALGAKAVVRAHEEEIVNVIVDDEGCLIDVDTEDDYKRLRER